MASGIPAASATATTGTRMTAAPGSVISPVGWVYRPPRCRCSSRSAAASVPHRSSGSAQAVFPALPSGRWLDAQFERALSAGAILTAGGGLLRLAGPASYGWALAGQFVVAAGQPLVLNSITKVAARYFPAPERTAAISAGS